VQEISKYIDNVLFIKWVYEPDDDLNEYWSYYLEKHPEERLLMNTLKKELGSIRISNQQLSKEQKERLAARILQRLRKEKQTVKIKQYHTFFLRYAAMAIVFLCMGGLIVYLFQERKSEPEEAQYIDIPGVIENPTLILADGSIIDLEKNEPRIDLSTHNCVIVNEDSIIPLNVNTEKRQITQNQIIVPYGTRARVVLSDRSVVWLNAGTRLIYPSRFSGDRRAVALTGEAFFEVAKNRDHPFIVKTANYNIKVLGTQFNVSAYPGDDENQTVLTEGSIQLTLGQDRWFNRQIVLKPDELFAYNKKSNSTRIEKVQAEMYTLWKEGILRFEKEDLSRIVKKLERFYDIRIDLKNSVDGSMKLDGKLNLKQNTNEVMHYICKVGNRNFKKINEKYYVIE
jgi:ferric-dicitrate binding protein FerR (iron transport regulator)